MLNQAVLMGRLVADPELRHTPNNIAVVSFRIAVDRNYQRQGAERETDFIDIVAWRQTAEFISRYFRKGSMIVVQGSIQTRSYTDSQGIKRRAFEIVADQVFFGESKSSAAANSGTSFQAPSFNNAPAASGNQAASSSNYFESAGVDGFQEIPEDDDLPF